MSDGQDGKEPGAVRAAFRPDITGVCAILMWILAAVMYGDGGAVAWLAIAPLAVGCFMYGVAQYYDRESGWKESDGDA